MPDEIHLERPARARTRRLVDQRRAGDGQACWPQPARGRHRTGRTPRRRRHGPRRAGRGRRSRVRQLPPAPHLAARRATRGRRRRWRGRLRPATTSAAAGPSTSSSSPPIPPARSTPAAVAGRRTATPSADLLERCGYAAAPRVLPQRPRHADGAVRGVARRRQGGGARSRKAATRATT